MPRFINEPQGSLGWHAARAGSATASRFADILAGKGARDAYLWELVAERLAGPMRDAGGFAKVWGADAEGLARNQFQVRTGKLVREVGFAQHDRIKWCGASTDGLVEDDEFVEIKSPFNSSIHARTLRYGMPDMHYPQVQGNAWILQRKRGLFLSYDPAFAAPYDLYIQPIERDESFIRHLEKEVKKFLSEVNIAVRDITASQK